MNEQTIELLRELSEKLGTTADHLWGVMLAQAPIAATWNTWTCIAMGAVAIVLWGATGIVSAASKSDYDAGPVVMVVVSAIFTVIALIAIPIIGYEAYTAAHNPEFWALQQLLP